jgi:hypothetical protein
MNRKAIPKLEFNKNKTRGGSIFESGSPCVPQRRRPSSVDSYSFLATSDRFANATIFNLSRRRQLLLQ